MKKTRLILLLIMFIAVFLRTAAAIYLGDQVVNLPGTYDQVSYHELAIRVASGHSFSFDKDWWPATRADSPTAHWSFLYTYFLVVVYKIFGVHPLLARIFQAVVVGIFQPWLAFLIARRLFNERSGLISAGLTAIYTYFIYYAATLMTEPFYITTILACLFLGIRLTSESQMEKPKPGSEPLFLYFGFGLCIGAAVLFRQLFLLFVPFLFFWILWVKRVQFKVTFWGLMLSSSIILASILPITYFNYQRFHRFVLLNTNAGYAFFWGNHPIYGTRFESILPPEMGTYAELIPTELLSLDEAALDQALLKLGLKFITDDPIRYILLSFSRIQAYFLFWPSPESGTISNLSRVASFGILWPFMLYGVVLVFWGKQAPSIRKFSSPSTLLLLFALVYIGIHLLTWTLIRYRLPVDAVLLVYAGFSIDHIKTWLSKKTKT